MKLVIAFIVTFLSGLFTTFFINMILNSVDHIKEKRVFRTLIFGFEKYTNHSQLYSVGPLIMNCILWVGMTEKEQRGWKQQDISFSFEETSKLIPDEMNAFIEANWNESEIENQNLRNEARSGVRKIDFSQDPHITFGETNYKNFIGTNKSISNKRFAHFITETERKILSTKDGFKFLPKSLFSNDLATATTVITADNYILLAKRSKEVFVLKDVIHTSIAEGMDLKKDWNSRLDAPDVFKTIVRGAKEELNIDVEPTEIELTSFGLYRPFMQPFVTAKIKVPFTHDQVINKISNHKDSFEGNVFAVQNNLTNIAPFLFDRTFLGQDLKMAELGKVSIIQCLMQQYGEKKLQKELIHTYKVVEKYF